MRREGKDAGKRRAWADGALYMLGCALYAVSVNYFTAPNDIAPGGVTGVAILVRYLTGMPIGTFMLAANLPLLWMTWKRISVTLAVRTAIVTLFISALIDGTAPYTPHFTGEPILAAVFGGVVSGVGLGLIYMRGATTGGSELVARLIGKRMRHIPVGRLILAVDAVVVVASAVVFGNIEAMLYAVVLIYVSTTVMDGMIYGGNKGRMLLIVTAEEQVISKAIMERMSRGVTLLHATGAYTQESRGVLMCAVRPSEVYGVRTLVTDIDARAFIVITTSEAVFGEGFARHRQEA